MRSSINSTRWIYNTTGTTLAIRGGSLKRRNFLQRGGLAGVSCASLLLAAPMCRAIGPIRRRAPSRLRISLAAYSLRKYLQSTDDKPAEMDLFEFVDFCHEHDLAGAELTSYYFPTDVDEGYLLKLKRHCHVRGVSISGGAIRNDFTQLDPLAVARDLAHTRQWIGHYAKLGAPAIRIFAGKPIAGEVPSKTLTRCAQICQLACVEAARQGVMLALENHGGVTARAEGLLEIVRQVESPAFGVNLDSGNFNSGDDPYRELEMIAPYAVNAQIKVEMKVSGVTQATDLARVMQILRQAQYSGWVALEYEAADEPMAAIARYLEQLKQLADG